MTEVTAARRGVAFFAAFCAMFVISPFEYAWSVMSGHVGALYGWSHERVALLFTLFVIFQSVGMLPGGMLRDRFGPRWTTAVAGLASGAGLWALTLGPSYALVVSLWCVGSFFTGFIYNNAVTTGNKWFPDRRGLMTGLIAGAFSWGSLPFIFPIRAIAHGAPVAVFIGVVHLMALVIGGVALLAGLFMRDPPAAWRPAALPAVARPSQHQYTLAEALGTWQLWALIVSFILISSAGLAGMSKMVAYSNSFRFTATAATAAAGGIALANGFGKLVLGGLADRFGPETMMIVSYIICGLLLFATVAAGEAGDGALFVVAAIGAIFFWAALFALFPITIGHYFGEVSAGGTYGLLYAIAKGLGGIYGGILSTILIVEHGFPFAISVGGVMAVLAGLLIVPLRFHPPRGRAAPAAVPDAAAAG